MASAKGILPMRIAHLTSAHPRYDVRIFLKECRSLARAGHSVTLIVADNLKDEVRDSVNIVSVGPPSGRCDRMLRTPGRVLRKAVAIDADVYHLHDPELLPIGIRLKARGKHVLFDTHEDLPRSVLSKHWIPRALRPIISRLVGIGERFAARQLTGVIAATPSIARRFDFGRVAVVQNFPIVDELRLDRNVRYSERPAKVSYVGAVTRARGALEIARAVALLPQSYDVKLCLAGGIRSGLVEELTSPELKHRVEMLGQVSRSEVAALLAESRIGLVTFHPEPNHLEAQPNKLFEYMSAALPVVASDFPLWRRIVDEAGCGILVDPRDPSAIAAAIRYLLDNMAEAEEMGRRGLIAVRERFNWSVESEHLVSFYQDAFASSK